MTYGPKVHGAFWLHGALWSSPLRFFNVFSSIAGLSTPLPLEPASIPLLASPASAG